MKFILLLACFFASSCTTNKIPQFQNSLSHKSVHDISHLPLDNSLLFSKNSLKGKLEESDSIVTYETTSSSYDLYELKNLSSGQYKITMKSYCDCFGLAKYIAIPHIFHIDDQRNLLTIKQIENKPVSPMFGRFYIQKSWEIHISDNLNNYLIVSSLNEELGNSAAILDGTTSLNGTTYYIGGIQVKSSPYGEYSLSIEQKSPEIKQ
jgi:hypothetical protein